MRVLFLESHSMWIHGLPNGFCDAGHEVLVSGPLTKENIPAMLAEFRPHLVVTMGWTPETTVEKANWICGNVKRLRIPHAYWATEDPTHTEKFTLPLIKVMQPDFVFTICPQKVDYYKKMGIQAAHMDFAYHSSVHHYTGLKEKYRCDIAVVANGYSNNLKTYSKHYRIQSIEALIKPLVKENIRIDFYGWGWNDMKSIVGSEIPKEWCHGYLDYTLANEVYSSAKIIIGLQNHPTQLTQRTYETLASKGFLLTSDTPEVRRLFKPGRDLVVSASPQETLELVRYYLESAEKRDKIREHGYMAVLPYSYTNRAKYMVSVLSSRDILLV